MLASDPYVRIPKIDVQKGNKLVDGGRVLARLEIIQELLTSIALRVGNPLWVPMNGEVGYTSWLDFEKTNHVAMPYPGTRLAQAVWFEHDVAGFNSIEHWCYLKHEEVKLMQAIGKRIPEHDHAWTS